jgi:phage-related protein
VRQKSSAFLSLLQGDQFDLTPLIEIQTSTTPLRYCIDTHPRTWNGMTFEPTAGGFTEVEESAERRIPALRLALQNADGVLGQKVHPDTGGEDVRGRRVSIWQVSRDLLGGTPPLDFAIEWVFFIESYSWIGREAVVFDIGVFPAEAIRVPDRTLQGLRCRWIYKGEHCGYVGDLATCDKTLFGSNGCKVHFPEEPLRFGGFPTSADARALRV